MKEYIEREAALVAIKNLYPGIPFVKALRQRWHDDNRAYMQCERAVDAIPAADVVEVRHGRWIYFKLGGWKCSECNNQAPFWCMASTQNLSDYCPNCGAKMSNGERKGGDE